MQKTFQSLGLLENCFKEGTLSAQEKSLVALATAQRPYCIDAYSSDAFEKGRSENQMMEAVHVATAIKGG